VRTKVRQPLPLLGGATTSKGAVVAREGKALLTLGSCGALFYTRDDLIAIVIIHAKDHSRRRLIAGKERPASAISPAGEFEKLEEVVGQCQGVGEPVPSTSQQGRSTICSSLFPTRAGPVP